MKTKQIIALFLGLILVFSAALPSFAYSDSKITGEYVFEGDNKLTVEDPDTVSIFYFVATSEEELGTYRVSTDSKLAKLRSYCGTVGFRYDNTESTDYDPGINSYTFTATSVGTPYLIGVRGKESFTLNLYKDSDYKIPQSLKDEFKEFVHYAYKKYNFIVAEDAKRVYVDVTQPHTVVRDNRGFYHLDSLEGPILYIDIFNTPYVNLYEMALNDMLRYYSYDSNGNYQGKYNDSGMYLEYAYYADPVSGIYPYDTHLAGFSKFVGKDKGWFDRDRENGYYLFGDKEVNKESAHLFCFFYFEDESKIKRSTGHINYPYNLAYNNPYGNFCEINGTRYSDHSKFFKLDVYDNSAVTCMAISPSLSTYKAFCIKYGDQTFKPNKDGVLTFNTDGSSDMIEVQNTGSTDGVTFVLMLSPAVADVSGDGSATAPYSLICDDGKLASCTVEKNSFLNFRSDKTNGAYVIASATNTDGEEETDVYASYGGQLHYPNASGLIIFPLSSTAGNAFKINNTANYERYVDIMVVSDLSVLNPEGCFENPVELEYKDQTVHLTTAITDESLGQVYYSYTAPKDGVLSFEYKSSTSYGWTCTLTNTTTGYTTSNTYLDSNKKEYFSIGVSKGDTVILSIGTYDGMRFWHTPKGEVSWTYKLKNAIKGDVDFDFTINAKDTNILKRIIAGTMSASTASQVADVNSDSTVNAIDGNMLKRYLAGQIKEF